MKEHKLFAALVLTAGLTLAPLAVLADETKSEDEKASTQHDTKSEHTPGGGKAVKKDKEQKAQAAGNKAAAHQHSLPDDDEDEEEGSH